MGDRSISPAIKCIGIGKSYDGGDSYAAKNVSFDVQEGETVVLLGSSGSGKSTVLKSINRLIELSEGSIEVRGRDVKDYDPVALRRSIGYVSQSISLFPFLRVWENVTLPLKLRGVSREERIERARTALSLVQLPESASDRSPTQLSGGQQQRVGVARALIGGSSVLLMDEPFGALDAITRDTLQDEVIRIKEQLLVSILFVTHDIFEAIRLGDRIAVMHQGSLQQISTVDVLRKEPATEFVSKLFKRAEQQVSLLSR